MIANPTGSPKGSNAACGAADGVPCAAIWLHADSVSAALSAAVSAPCFKHLLFPSTLDDRLALIKSHPHLFQNCFKPDLLFGDTPERLGPCRLHIERRPELQFGQTVKGLRSNVFDGKSIELRNALSSEGVQFGTRLGTAKVGGVRVHLLDKRVGCAGAR